jgi:hypothetical protein
MLAPAHPDRNDPAYREKKEQHRKDREELRQHPERWGFVRGGARPAPAGTQQRSQE